MILEGHQQPSIYVNEQNSNIYIMDKATSNVRCNIWSRQQRKSSFISYGKTKNNS